MVKSLLDYDVEAIVLRLFTYLDEGSLFPERVAAHIEHVLTAYPELKPQYSGLLAMYRENGYRLE